MNIFNLTRNLILLAFIITGCGSTNLSPIPTKTPIKLGTENPSIRGKITNIFITDGKITGIFIEGTIETDTLYDKAIVGINAETHFYVSMSGDLTDSDASHLEVGQTVEAFFIGPIATSYPVQARAVEIVIIK